MPVRPRHPRDWNTATADEDLVRWAQQGQREAFGLLYDRHVASIYGYCYRRLGEREAAQDATAETFRKALVGLPSYRPAAFRAWLFAIARHVVADTARRPRHDLPLVVAMEVPDPGASIEEAAVMQADLAALVALLPRLTPDQHDVIAMRLAGLTPIEIGEALGKSRGAIDMALHRALARLRELMLADSPVVGGKGRV
jgi:RNA polymerase sigma-70 factor (ECF subfamily)